MGKKEPARREYDPFSGQVSEGTGILTVTAVPRPGLLSMVTCPRRGRTRSCLLVSPRPFLLSHELNPLPLADTRSSMWPAVPESETATCLALACLRMFPRLSWSTRYRQMVNGIGNWAGT